MLYILIFQFDLLHLLHQFVGFNKFSLFLDESTDIAIRKVLGIGIHYFDNIYGKIVSTFLSLIELSTYDAKSIAN